MATRYRRKHNLLVSTLGATLATGATSITFAAALQEGGSNIATLGTDEYLVLTISPAAAPNEVVYLTAYTAGATTGTIVRAQEGTVDPGTTYASGTPVVNGPTKADWPTAWTAYTPSYSGGTIGNATVSGRYTMLGFKTALLHIELDSGSTTNIGANTKMSFGLPFGTAVNAAPDQMGSGVLDGAQFLTGTFFTVACAIQRNTSSVIAITAQAIVGAGFGLYLSIVVELA